MYWSITVGTDNGVRILFGVKIAHDEILVVHIPPVMAEVKRERCIMNVPCKWTSRGSSEAIYSLSALPYYLTKDGLKYPGSLLLLANGTGARYDGLGLSIKLGRETTAA